jgi:hypothetical protein
MTNSMKIDLTLSGRASVQDPHNPNSVKAVAFSKEVTLELQLGGDGERDELAANLLEELVRYLGNVVRGAADEAGCTA